jgi:hypothetical protein
MGVCGRLMKTEAGQAILADDSATTLKWAPVHGGIGGVPPLSLPALDLRSFFSQKDQELFSIGQWRLVVVLSWLTIPVLPTEFRTFVSIAALTGG